jgi:hypothetical protein
VTKAADLIAALLPRKAAPVLERHTGLPYGWGIWMRGLPARLGTITREKAENVVTLLMLRPAPAPEPVPRALNKLQSLRALFYQDWDPPPREERGIRWFAGFVSLVMHLLFFLLLVLAALVNVSLPPPAGDSSRVQVEFIGQGTPEEEGGGPPVEQPAPAPPAAAASTAATATARPRSMAVGEPATPALTSEVPELQQREVPEPSPPAAPQPLQVTETPTPTTEFILPPPTPRTIEIAPPQVRTREVGVPMREVTVLQAPPAQRELPQRPVDVLQIAVPEQQVQQREVAPPAPQVREMQVPSREIGARELRAPTASVREAEIAAPQPRPAPTGTAPTPAPAQAPGNASSQTANTSPPSGAQQNAVTSGPTAASRPGGRPTPRRADDWGDSTRNVPGQAGVTGSGERPGLFNSDGSVRVPGTGGDVTGSRGAPGGDQDAWTRERLEQAGTWLQRPPYDYEPTAFDKFWVPNESLLQEWVRKNIRETSIPIPGTSKRLKCVVSILQLGGGCGIVDPNLNEQPAEARPPPDIPVKRTPIPTDS